VSFEKYGHETFQPLDPPRRYLTMTSSQSFSGGNPESGPLGVSGTRSATIDPLTGNSSVTGESYINTGGNAQSPARRSGRQEISGYDDPPNKEDDDTGTINFTSTLSGENTTAMMVANGKSKLKGFTGTRQPGTPFAYRNVHKNELVFDYQKTQFQFRWKPGVTAEQRGSVTCLLVFQPEDDPDTKDIDESTKNAEVVETITWDGAAGESRFFTIDPDQKKSGVDGGYRLLPVEVKDIKDHANTGDDVVISNRTTAQTITAASVAWIEAHKSATDDTPRMPQLVFNIPDFPQGVSLEAKLLVEYERPYAGKQADDTVKVPANGSFKSITNGRWEIWNDYSNLSFFGGDATLTYKINGGEEQTIRFAIGGRNPDDLRCKAYTQGRSGASWYAYAIEKHESQSYNAGFYNQFWERSGNSTPVNPGAVNYVFTNGDPIVIRTPPETGVGGAGLAQVTGAGGVKTVSAPREIFWNWQKNVDAFLNILSGKVAEAESAMNNSNPRNPPNPRPDGQRHQSRFDTGNFVSVPLISDGVDKGTQGRIKFSDNSNHKRPEDAVAIKRYNGAQADWCSWAGSSVSDTANHHWQWNYGANDYVTKVSNQVEEQQP
jgi:hypothetical protein